LPPRKTAYHIERRQLLLVRHTAQNPAAPPTVAPAPVEAASARSDLGLWALSAAFDPSLDQVTQLFLAAGGWIAPGSWIPTPRNQVVARQVFMQQLKAASTIALRVFDLPANFANRFAFPGHLDRRKAPARMTRYALEGHSPADEHVVVSIQVTTAAGVACYAAPICPAGGGRRVPMHVVALRGTIACWVTIHAARTHDHLCSLSEQGARAR
jgi:hypothetical protein